MSTHPPIVLLCTELTVSEHSQTCILLSILLQLIAIMMSLHVIMVIVNLSHLNVMDITTVQTLVMKNHVVYNVWTCC